MNTPINLNKARKKKMRAAKRAQADENSVQFGRTKAERQQTKLENNRISQVLDGKVLELPEKGKVPGRNEQ